MKKTRANHLAHEITHENLSQKIAKGGIIIMIFTLLSSPLGFLFRILFSRSLSIEMYGLFYAVLSFFSIFISYNDLGFGYSLTYFTPKFVHQKKFNQIWKMFLYDLIIELITSIIISLFLILLANQLSIHYFKTPQASLLVVILCFFFITNSVVSALQKLFTGLQEERLYSSIEFSRMFFSLIISLVLWLLNQASVFTFGLAWGLGYLFSAIIYSGLFIRKYKFMISKFSWDKELFLKMFKYAIPTLLTVSISMLISSTDVFFLTLFKSVTHVGIYNIVLPLASVAAIFISPLQLLFLPVVSKYIEISVAKVSLVVENLFKLIPFLGLYFGVFTSIFAPQIIQTVFGKKWLGVSELPLEILSIGYTLILFSSFLATVISGLGEIKTRLKAIALIAVINVILASIFSYFWGVLGIVVSNIIIYLISIILFSQIIKRRVPFQVPWVLYGKYLIFWLSIWVLAKQIAFKPENIVALIVCGIIYSIIVILFGLSNHIIDNSLIDLVKNNKIISRFLALSVLQVNSSDN